MDNNERRIDLRRFRLEKSDMSAYQIKLKTNDGEMLSFACDAEEDLVSAAEKENIYLAAQCKAGACGACIAHHETGDYHLGEYSNDAFTEHDRSEDQVLLCRTYPESDLTMTLPYAYSVVRFEKMPEREAEIVAKTYLTEDTVKLDLQLLPDEDDNLSLDFEPGQFMEIHIPEDAEEAKRAYSLANAPNWDGSLEFLIKLRENGQFSNFLDQKAQAGMKLRLDGPMGTFMLQDRGLRPRYFVAGGCGLASVMSMLRRMAEWEEPHPVKLFFGVWNESEVFFQQEIEALAAEYPKLDYKTCVTQPSESWKGYKGSVVTAFKEALRAETAKPDVYICGSPGLIEGIAEAAQECGVDRSELIYERYLANAQPTGATRCEVIEEKH